ncbi:MAG: WYL domain-containing transcriptional regulator [Pirellulales bacterium]
MARNEQLIRQHKLLQILERYRYGRSLKDLRDELVEAMGLGNLHERSVRRDLQALQAAGFDLDTHDTQSGRVWRLGPMFRRSHELTVSASELIALSMARDLMHPLVGTPFWHALETFWNNVRQQLPDPVWKHYEKYRRAIAVRGMPHKSYDAQQGMLRTLHRAIQEHRVTEIDYQSLGQKRPGRRRIHPYGIVFYEGSLYVVAWSEAASTNSAKKADAAANSANSNDSASSASASSGSAGIRHLKLDRFHHALALDEWFTPDPEFSLENHWSGSLGIFATGTTRKYHLRLSPHAAAWVREDPWHPDQKLVEHPDGSAELTVPAAHEMEILPRVLALGADAELLGPAPARQRLSQILTEMAGQYAE